MTTKIPEKALKTLKSVSDWHAGDSEISLYMGLAFAYQKKIKLAIEELENAILLNRKFDLPYYYIGLQYINSSPDLSKKYLKKFIDLSIKKPENQSLVLKAHKLLGKL